jgi:hypothetical protein
MRTSENASKVRATRRRPRPERLFTITNREIMADLMYGRDEVMSGRAGRVR